MAVEIDPLYAPKQDYNDGEKFNFANVGDKVYGTIVKVNKPVELTNRKYNPEKDPAWKATYRAQFVTVDTGAKVYNLMLTGAMFQAVGEALQTAEQSTLMGLEGWSFGQKWENVKQTDNGMAKVWKFRLDAPTEGKTL